MLLALWVLSCSSSPGPGHVVKQTDGGGEGIARRPDGGGGPDATTTDASTTDGPIEAGCGSTGLNKDTGLPCGCAAECKSNFCVGGFCCNSACDGTCMTCALATSLGTCTMVPAGAQPQDPSQCRIDKVSTCGQDGTCDGQGSCGVYPVDTVCTKGTCSGAEIIGTYGCDGAGSCKAGPILICAPYLCSTTSNQCLGKCTADTDCVAGEHCLGGSCGPKALGQACGGDGECDSLHCAGGFCCDSACSGACQSCDQVGFMGTCTPTPSGQGHPLCLKQAPATCGTTGICDGKGGCSSYPANSPCASAACVDSVSGNSTRTCDGLGTCLSPQGFTCGNFACASGACKESCTTAADCAPGHACTIPTGKTVGTCGQKVDGQTCTVAADCVNGNCVDGICCATTCTGACRSCAVAGSLGTCTMITAGGADPRGACKDLTAAMCSTDGKCDGAGACRKYAAGTVCAPETCSGSTDTKASTCSAAGVCTKPAAASCSPYQCNGSSCYAACTADTQCLSPNTCGMGGVISSCGKKPSGQSCSSASQCVSGLCAQGVCCNTACNTACHACNIAGSLGVCVGVTASSDPQGMCVAQAQTTCGATGQCQSGLCAKWPAGTQCGAASCSNGTPPTLLTPASKCDGAGDCAKPASESCPGICGGGACGFQVKGGGCASTSQCTAGLTCVSGVCCNSTCTGSCSSCTLAGKVGTCSPVAAGPICRAANGACDVAETCNGTSLTCPADGFASSSTVCRAANGACDVAEKCTGTSTACPADGFMAAATVCRASAGACDVAETCSGTSAACPANGFMAATTVCRASAGTCDVAENCTGSAAACPADGFMAATTVCRAANGACDVAENCTGKSGTCPADGFAPAATVCRAVNGACDVAENCTGKSGTCPADGFAPAATVCRAVNGACDVAETCSGTSAVCPADGFAASSKVCRPSAGACDVAESCTGSMAACPADAFMGADVVCSPASCSEDGSMLTPASNCDGVDTVCPAPGMPVSCLGDSCLTPPLCIPM